VKGITSYGVSLPYYRIRRETIFEAMGWFTPGLAALRSGEKTVANHDEDSLTLAVAAGKACFSGADLAKIQGLFLASTTMPYRERSNAGIALAALNLSPECRTLEFGGEIKSGVAALVSALRDDGGGSILVCASDCRTGKAGGTNEMLFGDGAAAVTVGDRDVIATFEGAISLSYDFPDYRRLNGDPFVRSWEERWIRVEGFNRFIPQALDRLLKQVNIGVADVAKVVFPPMGPRDHIAMGKQMGLEKAKIQDPLIEVIGHTGTAHPLIMLAAALEDSNPGDYIAVLGYGGGAEALLLKVTEAVADLKGRRTLQRCLEYKQEMDSYTKYLSFKNMVEKEAGIRGEEIAVTSLSLTWREQDAVIRLAGGRCLACGTPQFPRERICINPKCGQVDIMERYVFSDKTGRLFTYTADHLAYSEDPPSLYGIVDFEGGGRYWFDLADCRLESLKVGQPVQMTFRRKYRDEARSLYGYFWKATPFKG
jgi:hydroxymethylglutaryl-CoA synthase